MSTQSFSLTALAAEIRQYFPDKYGRYHDDPTCVREFTSDNSMNVTLEGADYTSIGEIGPLTKNFYTRIIDTRNKLLEIYVEEVETGLITFKKRAADLMTAMPAFAELSGDSSAEAGLLISAFRTMTNIHSTINGYYKIMAEDEDSREHFDECSGVLFVVLESLINNSPITEDMFTDKTGFMKDSTMKLSSLFLQVDQFTRRELIQLFKSLMSSILACFILYRIPVGVVPGKPPLYLSRFIPLVKLKPFLILFGVNLGQFTIVL